MIYMTVNKTQIYCNTNAKYNYMIKFAQYKVIFAVKIISEILKSNIVR